MRSPTASADARDAHRFEELYREWYRPVVALCRRLLASSLDAEAVAQEAFIRAWRSWDRFDARRPFGPWVATIARRLCFDEARAHSSRDQRLARAASALASLPVPDPYASLPDTDAVDRALADLPPAYRRVLFLRDVDGWSYSQIARFEGVTTESVRASLRRARAAFRRVYGEVSTGVLGGVASVLRRVLRAMERSSAVMVSRVDASNLVALAASVWLCGGTAAMAVDTPMSEVVPAAVASPTAASPSTAVPRTAWPSTPHRRAAPDGGGSSLDGGRPTDARDLSVGTDYRFTASPSYAEDHTAFAAGRRTDCVDSCGVLFRSNDGGATWARLPAQGFVPGPILLPPAYPRDHRIFSVSVNDNVLWVSEDDGATFRPLGAVPGVPVLSARFSDGDPRMLFPATDMRPVATEYRYGGAVVPLRLPLPAGATPMGFAFSPAYAEDETVLVSVKEVGAPEVDVATGHGQGWLTSRVYACTPSTCHEVLDMGGIPPTIRFVPGGSVAFAWNGFALYRSTDGGRSFDVIDRPGSPGDAIMDITSSSDGRAFVTTLAHEAGISRRLYESRDDGDTWTEVEHNATALSSATALPDGTLLDAYLGGTPGMRCSTDGGRSWGPVCAARRAAA